MAKEGSAWKYEEGQQVTVDGLVYKIQKTALRGHPAEPIYLVVGPTIRWVREDEID